MALDTAIKNVGDYYAAHYLADKNGFAKDIAERTKAWKEQGSRSVVKRVQGLGDGYYKAKTRALDFPDPAVRARVEDTGLTGWHSALLHALGYEPEALALELESEQKQLPALLRLNRHNQPWLVVCETPFCLSGGDNNEEPLEVEVIPPTSTVDGLPTYINSWEKAVAMVFKQEDRPRWLMLLSGSRIYLFDAHTYAQGRYLYIDLDEAFGRKQNSTFEAICALIAKDSLAPDSESDDVLHERLREGSLKSTHGVSEKLQGAVRDAIQEIANGWVEARRASNLGYRQLGEREEPLPDGTREVTAEQLRHDALIYVYRLLFCLYAEARGGELGILPINDDVYRLGYSLEALRDLVEQAEPTTSTENGTYIAEHLNRLFALINKGFHPEQEALSKAAEAQERSWSEFGKLPQQNSLFGAATSQQQLSLGGGKVQASTNTNTFVIQPLTATLFDPGSTPLLNRIKLPNVVLHKVVRCLSLGTGDKGKRIGRINYAELGIVQLGSVYEGLLSYKGFFAKEDLIQVVQKPQGGKVVLDNAIDPKVPTWFVPATRESEFKAGEIVLEHSTQKPRIYKTGAFILHLNGVDRVNSASYYTPEVLTRCLVREALKERLKDFGPEQADDILKLAICEPAMGSAAFLVEAIDQLGREYLRLKQAQTGKSIDPSDFEDELRRVRHYIAVHNVYGVDLNPTAVELGALSLWLASIHRLKVKDGENGVADEYRPCATPWFGLRLRAGNSLIGARRAVWTKQQLISGKFYGKDAEAPRQLKPGEIRKEDEIYHFLVWSEDMAPAANDKLMRQYWPDECDEIKTWRNQEVKRRWLPEQIAQAKSICTRIDLLWQDYAKQRVEGLARSECTATVWPTPSGSIEASRASASLAAQERIKANLESQSGAFQRLKLLMDCWCSFYFWPLQDYQALPNRNAWLSAAEVLLGCDSVQNPSTRAMLDTNLGEEIDLEVLFIESQQQLPDAQRIAQSVPWFAVARATDSEQRFHHWELIFTEVLGPETESASPSGFDLIFGNPPWIKLVWENAIYLAEFNPMIGVRDYSSPKCEELLPEILESPSSKSNFFNKKESFYGCLEFLGDKTIYPELKGIQSNLYKNFIIGSWRIVSIDGAIGFIHPDNIFSESKANHTREKIYRRLTKVFHFVNAEKLFAEILHWVTYCACIYKGSEKDLGFDLVSNLYSVSTIDQCFNKKDDLVYGLKDENGKWEKRGSLNRVIRVNEAALKVFGDLWDDSYYKGAQLPFVYDNRLVKVLSKISSYKSKLSLLGKGFSSIDSLLDQTKAQKDGLMTEGLFDNSEYKGFVFSAPHIFVSDPVYQCPNEGYKNQHDYHSVDHTTISPNYVPRSLYRLKVDYNSQYIVGSKSIYNINAYRMIHRRRFSLNGERSLMCALMPEKSVAINTCVTSFFDSDSDLLNFVGICSSIVMDYIVRVIGKGDLYGKGLLYFPFFRNNFMVSRVLLLNCVGRSYDRIFSEQWMNVFDSDSWVDCKNGLRLNIFKNNERDVASRYSLNSLERRQALLEIDVIVSIELGISVEELIAIYKVQFPVMNAYELIDQYDITGQRLPNTARKDAGAKELRDALRNHDGLSPVTVSWEIDNGNQTATKTFYPPFKHVDRIEDYKTAYRVFSERLGLEKDDKACA